MKELCQDDDNAEEFYTGLALVAANAADNRAATIANTLALRAKERGTRTKTHYAALAGEQFQKEARNVSKPTRISDGMRTAIAEETRAISGLSSFLWSVADERVKSHIRDTIIEKLCTITELNTIYKR